MASGVVKNDLDWAILRIGKDQDAVQLRFYETSLYYDCTFSASVSHHKDGESCAKKFKCHRFVLAAASEVFEQLLSGGFKRYKDANLKGRDDEIKIEVSPTVFDLAMRFIYGSQSDFQSCELAIKIYYFACKWMIEGLHQAAREFLIKQLRLDSDPDDALLVLEMCIDLNIDSEADIWDRCSTIFEEKTLQVLSSKHWLAASWRTIITIHCLLYLSVSEAYLLKKLVAWGMARCSNDKSKSVRAEIDPVLKKIRFRSMSCQEFSAISKECDVLTTEEKLKILESLVLSDANLMPPGFCRKGFPRNLSNSQKVDWSSVGKKNDGPGENESTRFSFYVDQCGIFLEGIYLQSTADLAFSDDMTDDSEISIICSVHKSDSGIKLGTALFATTKLDWKMTGCNLAYSFIRLIGGPVALAKDILHYIEIEYNSIQASPTSFMNGDGRKFHVCPGICTVFHSATKVRDVFGFQLNK